MMGQFIIKTLRSEPHYILFSTIVDSPVMICIGRQQLIDYMVKEQGTRLTRLIEEQVDRADEFGTSSPYRGGFEDDDDIRFQEVDKPNPGDKPGCWWIPRAKLDEWFMTVERDGWEAGEELLIWKDWE